jgi:endonuclease/exonuclease/phosphatase family metal-dependent hydrolase
VRIATFNLENLGQSRSTDHATAGRLALLRPQLLRLDADIVCLQEINAPRDGATGRRSLAALDELLRETPYEGFHRTATHHPEGDEPMDRHNLAIVSRHPIVTASQVFHDLVPPQPHATITADDPGDGLVRWERPLLHAVVALPGGRRLHVLNMHLSAPIAASLPDRKAGPFTWTSSASWAEGFYIAGLKRSGQALEARLVVEGILDEEPEALIVAAGDFNAEAAETPTRILMAGTEDTGNGALATRTLVALERSLPADRRYSVIHAGQHVMLDHLLASRALTAAYRGIEIHNEALTDELVAWSVSAAAAESYHAPVVATFELG